jgi:hypothetical protein
MNYRGQHLVVSRGIFTHHGIGDGNGGVIHYAGLGGDDSAGAPGIRRISLRKFASNARIHIRPHTARRFTPERALERARSRVGEAAYSVIGNNCEHFCNWSIEGDHRSQQIDQAIPPATAIVGGTAAGIAVRAVAATGAVVGLSGSGIMSGLATTGAAIGGGAASGIGVVTGGGGLGTAALLANTVFKDDAHLPVEERRARQTGRYTAYGSSVAGGAGAVAVVAAAGTPGLSAVGISSGLAAVGGTMAGGIVVLTAGTAIATAATAYGAYRLFKWWRS